ncbi:MAG: hypothetical protein SF182_03065 [Deltaproteobacteria bacterium]|nr:hypothetical protein [Deltaproteobacteria bacterium]
MHSQQGSTRRAEMARTRGSRPARAALLGALALALAAPPAGADTPCVGDCGNAGQVTVSDMVTGVNIVLGALPPSACPAFQNGQGTVDVAQLIAGVNNLLNGCGAATPTPTATPIFSGKQRRFVIAPGTPNATTAASRSGLFSSGLSNTNAATAICGKLAAGGQSCDQPAVMTLILDDEDQGDGIHDMPLKDDVTLEIGVVDGSRVCLKFLADFTQGYIACDGGARYDIVATRPADAPGVDFTYTRDLGPLAGPGNANLLVSAQYRIVPAGDATPCAQLGYTGTVTIPFTTTTGTATVGGTELSLAVGGQAFSCANFATPGSGGVLTAPIPAHDAAAGNLVNALRFGEPLP